MITAPRLRLRGALDVERLEHTVAPLRPRLLVLDPSVRLHGCAESAASDVARLLDRLRELQRQHQVAGRSL